MRGILDVADNNRGRLPELFSGLDRNELGVPAAYPTSCEPQAWAAAVPLMFLRLLLRFDPSVTDGLLHVDPILPTWITELQVEGVPLGGSRVAVDVDGDRVEVQGLPGSLTLERRAREPMTKLHTELGSE